MQNTQLYIALYSALHVFDLPINCKSLQELLSVGKGSNKANVVSNDKYIMKMNKCMENHGNPNKRHL